MKPSHVGFIGGGRVTRILLKAFQNKQVEFGSVKVYDPDKDAVNALRKLFPEVQLVDTLKETTGQELVVLAVHPPVMMDTIESIKDSINEATIILSLSPKITIEKMETVLPTSKIIRMIPNATSYINKGYNPVTFHGSFTHEERKPILKLLKKAGKTMEVDEEMLEGYAIVSAMLPTYFWFQWKKMEEIALTTGFTQEKAKKVVRKTLKRSLKLYYNPELTPGEVMDLIPVKPIGEHEPEIEQILESKLTGLYKKIKP